MKKFSKVSNIEVSSEPKTIEPNKKEVEINEFKHEIMKLMDDFLSIRSYGVARPEIMIPTHIVGKEMFVEALTDLLTKKSSKDQVKTLESLKSTNQDWKSIDDKITSMDENIIDIKEAKKINDIIEKYGSDESNLNFYLEGYVNRLTSEDINKKSELVDNMMKKSSNPLLKTISDKLKIRLNQQL